MLNTAGPLPACTPMCSLIVLRGLHRSHPVLCAGNRDERRDRPASPPGLWIGQRHRLLSPRDRRAAGTWLAVDQLGRLAAITNYAGVPTPPSATTRGHLPHLALDQPTLAAAIDAVAAAVHRDRFGGFQLVLADAKLTLVLRYLGQQLSVLEWTDPVLVLSNEHGPGELQLPRLSAALQPGLSVGQRLDALAAVLLDVGGPGRHAVLKQGQGYGTVSSSLLAIPAVLPGDFYWRYAPGPPDIAPYRNYGNLAQRL